MKNNRKNRKLKFIREKNRLRLGMNVYKAFSKISHRMDERMIEYCKRDLKELAERNILKKYKLVLRNHFFQIGQDNMDFSRDVSTLLVTLHNRNK